MDIIGYIVGGDIKIYLTLILFPRPSGELEEHEVKKTFSKKI